MKKFKLITSIISALAISGSIAVVSQFHNKSDKIEVTSKVSNLTQMRNPLNSNEIWNIPKQVNVNIPSNWFKNWNMGMFSYERTYDNYNQKREESWNYENALSHIITGHSIHEIMQLNPDHLAHVVDVYNFGRTGKWRLTNPMTFIRTNLNNNTSYFNYFGLKFKYANYYDDSKHDLKNLSSRNKIPEEWFQNLHSSVERNYDNYNKDQEWNWHQEDLNYKWAIGHSFHDVMLLKPSRRAHVINVYNYRVSVYKGTYNSRTFSGISYDKLVKYSRDYFNYFGKSDRWESEFSNDRSFIDSFVKKPEEVKLSKWDQLDYEYKIFLKNNQHLNDYQLEIASNKFISDFLANYKD